MGIFENLRGKKKEPEAEPAPREGLPNELEQFKLPPPRIEEMPSPFERKAPELQKPFVPHEIVERAVLKPEEKLEKLDLILSKLETIDARLKLLEEKLKR